MYIVSIADQTRIFLYSFGFGFILGVFYDLFRIIRLAITSGKIAVFIQDLLYFSACALASFAFILTINNGAVRGYIILGEVLGWILYYFSFGTVAIKTSAIIIRFIKKSFQWLIKIISAPFRWIYGIISKIFNRIIKKTKKKAKKIKNKSKFHLKLNRIMLYNLSSVLSLKERRKKREREDKG